MADANVVLKISSDVGNAITGLKSFVDLVGMAIGKIKDFAKENDVFVMASNRAVISIKEADEATNGLIDTTTLYTQQVKLAQAGVKLTENEYRAMAVASAELGKVTGDATGEFKRLTEGVAKGSTRALKNLGIQLDETEDLEKAQAEAVRKLTEKYGDMTVEVETLSEKMFVLENDVGTLTATLWKQSQSIITMIPGYESLHENLNLVTRGMEEGTGFADALTLSFSLMKSGLVQLLSPLAAAEESMRSFLGLAKGGGLQNLITYTEQQTKLDQMRDKVGRLQKAKDTKAAMDARLAAIVPVEARKKGSRSSGGKGGGRGGEMDFSEQEAFQSANEAALLEAMGGGRDDANASAIEGYLASGMGGEQGILGAGDIDPRGAGSGIGGDIYGELGGPQTAEEIQAKADAEMEAMAAKEAQEQAVHEAWVERWNVNTNMSDTWSSAWTNAVDNVDYKMNIINTTMGAFEDVTRSVVTAVVMGEKMTIKSFANMVKGVALQVGIEAQIQMFMSLAKAIGEAANSWGASPRIEMFGSAAAAYQVTAVKAFAVAGMAAGAGALAGGGGGKKGARAKGLAADRKSRYDGNGFDYSGSMAGRNDGYGTNVTVTLKGDADGLFKVVSEKNAEKKMAGESGI